MSTFGKKFLSVTLMATVAVWASGALLFVPAASAQSSTELQAQIAALLAQIQQLQAQLNAQSGAQVSSSYNFTRDLTVGSTGADVKALQQWLNENGYTVAASGAGSPGNETSYFGPATKRAVAAFQAANSVSPAAGYFGPRTRAAVASVVAVVPTAPTTPITPVTPTTPAAPAAPAAPIVPAPTTGLSVSLAASNPAAGSMISSSGSAAARVPVLAVNLTAGYASGITVAGLKFKKTGVISDSSISGAYVEESGKVLAQYTSISNGVISFPGLALNVAAGQTRTLTLSIDPAQGLSAGNTVGFAMISGSDVTATDATGAAVVASGNFPLNGNTFTVTSVSNPAIATLAVTSSSIGTTVYAGNKNVIVGAWSFTAANSKVWLKGLNFKVIGSASKADVQNVKLYVNGSQAGQTLATVPADGMAYFDLTAAPATLNTGSNNVQIYADVMGSPNFNFQFEILNSYDILAVDSQYNVPISGSSNTGTQVSINAGSITLTAASDTPTGNIAKGQTGVTLAKFSLYAAGEPVKIKWLTFGLTLTGAGTTSTLDQLIKNVHLDDDAGGQVGTTISSLMTTATCGSGGEAFSAATSSPVNCFGSSGSPINYIIPANTTRVLSLKGDIQSVANTIFSTVQGSLVAAASSNVQGMLSAATASTGAASGSALTLASNSLTVARNTAVGTQTISKGQANARIGSYAFSASSAEGVTISNLSVKVGSAGADFQNLRVKIGSSQFGSTSAVLGANTTYSFSGTPFTVPAGGTTQVDVYADVLSSATAQTNSTMTQIAGCSGSGASSLTAISCSSTNGQSVLVAGQSTIQVALDSASPAVSQIVMGSNGVTLASFRFQETTNIEDVKITDLNVFQQVASTTTVKSGFGNLSLHKVVNGVAQSTSVATAGSANTAASSSNPGSGYYYKFHFNTPVVVPQSNSVTLVLKGDVSTFAASGATDNTTHVFKVTTSTDSDNDSLPETVVALGSTSNNTSSVSLSSPNANALTVLRTKVAVTGATASGYDGHARTNSTENVGSISFTADAAGGLVVNTVALTLSGVGTSNATTTNHTSSSTAQLMDSVSLVDSAGGSCSATLVSTSSLKATFSLSNCDVSMGSSRTLTIRLNSSNVYQTAGTAGAKTGVTFSIAAATDIAYTDALSGGTANVNLNNISSNFPQTIASPTWTD